LLGRVIFKVSPKRCFDDSMGWRPVEAVAVTTTIIDVGKDATRRAK
jgi:hypothetical protein